ncbi:MAG: RNA polymerase sigma factor [Candidatus Zixiibacteriota bacterium]|nr:MAG: RNA polymerase sigma factor [candidate division Zixibacteria bacterium]
MNDMVQIISELSHSVFRLIRRVVGDRDQALDLTQETFIKVLTARGRPTEDSALRAYVMSAAYNLALNQRRDESRRRSRLEAYEKEYHPPGALQPDFALQQRDNAACIGRALELLPGKQREVVSLRFFGEMTFAEIASALKIKEGSVKVHLARGLNKLRDLTKTILSEEEL